MSSTPTSETPTSEAAAPSRMAAAMGWLRRNGLHTALEVAVNFAGPFLIFSLAKPRLGEAHALMASSAPPIAWTLVEFARRRRVDALSMLVLGGIGLSLLGYIGTRDPHVLLLRERLVTFAISLVFLGSAAIGRPLIYYLAMAAMRRRGQTSELAEMEGLSANPFFRRTMTIMTLVWGFGLLAECAVATTLVFTLTTKQFLLVAPVIGYSFAGALGLWTFWFANRQRRIGRARRAASAAPAQGDSPGPPE